MSVSEMTRSRRPGHAFWRPGNGACAGCGMSLGLQWLDSALDDEAATLIVPASCAIGAGGSFPVSAFGVPTAGTTFASSAAVATGVTRVRELNGEMEPTICWAGDGGTYDIGLATLSAAAERNENVIYMCYDNEIYGNTGGQRSSATLRDVKTATTPFGKRERKKDIMAIMAAHRVPYAATLSLAHREDFLRKVRTARDIPGFRFLVFLSPCPSGWKSDPAAGIDLARMAVGCGLYPLYEVFDGRRYRINARPDETPLEDYLSRQGRFRSGTIDVQAMRSDINRFWDHLERLQEAFPEAGEDR